MFIVKKILLVINIFIAIALLCTYIPYHIFSSTLPHITLLGYAYPFFLVANISFIILWLIIGSRRYVLLSIAVIAIHPNFITRLFNVSSFDKEDDKQITLLTYNVESFAHDIDYLEDNKDKLAKKQENMDSIISVVSKSKADIVIFQDYVANIKDSTGFHYRMTNVLKYRYYYYFYKGVSPIISNCVIYSKYHIRNASQILSNATYNSTMVWADIATPQGDIRVYNLHLVSYCLDKENKEAYSKIFHGNIEDTSASKSIIKKLVIADTERKYQVDSILQKLDSTPIPYIVAGDFNSIPFSYIYKQFSQTLSDSFTDKGNGWGRTYNGIFPAYRIDYVFYQKNRFKIHKYKSPSLDYSDHYPITVSFSIKEQ